MIIAVFLLTLSAAGCDAEPRRTLKPNASGPTYQGFGEATVVTGTPTSHELKDSPIETERIGDRQIEQAGASHIGQVLRDIPAIQSRR